MRLVPSGSFVAQQEEIVVEVRLFCGDVFCSSLTAISCKVMSAVLQGQISSYQHDLCTDI